MTRILIISFLITAFSCRNNSADKKADTQTSDWEILKIRVDKKSFYVPSDQDTCYYYPPADTNELKKPIQDQRFVSIKIILSKAQRDTIISLAMDAISNPKKTDQQVSCYAGQYVTISLEQMGTSISCKYSSISDWTKVSPTLNKINSMTFDKVKRDK